MDEPKVSFTRLTESLKEYSTIENIINDLESAKEKILKLLKTHRPVKCCDYEYGLTRSLKANHRLIIKELKNKSKIREYICVKSSYWWCCNRNSPRCKCTSSNLKIICGIVFAPIDHSDICELREYAYAMKVQDLLKQGKTKEAYE